MKEITTELTSVTGVTKDNFDQIVNKIEELFGQKLKEITDDEEFSIWIPDIEEQKIKLEESDTIQLFFMKVRE